MKASPVTEETKVFPSSWFAVLDISLDSLLDSKKEYLVTTIAILNHFLCTILMNFGKIKFMFLSEELKQKFDNLKRPT
jgi:hypothetical protein